MRQYEDDLAQRALENERYNTEYADSRSDTAWEQAFAREQWDAELAQQEWERGITEQQLADDRALTQAQIANYGRRSSGGSGGGSSGFDAGDFDRLLTGYSEASMAGQDDVAAMYAAALQGMFGMNPSSYGSTSTGAAPIGSIYDAADRARKEYNLTMDGTYRYLLDAGYDQDDIDRAMYEMQSLWG